MNYSLSLGDQFWQTEDDVSVRQIPPNRISITGRHASHKSDRSHAFESTLERDFVTLLEFDTTVVDYDEQPVRIKFLGSDERQHTHVPDFLVYFDQRQLPRKPPRLYQVKYEDQLRACWTKLKPALLAASRYAKAQGWGFQIITDRQIRTPYLNNARFLLPYTRYAPNFDDERILFARLTELRETTAQGLLASIYFDSLSQAQLVPTLWNLVGNRRIGLDLGEPLTMASRVWLWPD